MQRKISFYDSRNVSESVTYAYACIEQEHVLTQLIYTF